MEVHNFIIGKPDRLLSINGLISLEIFVIRILVEVQSLIVFLEVGSPYSSYYRLHVFPLNILKDLLYVCNSIALKRSIHVKKTFVSCILSYGLFRSCSIMQLNTVEQKQILEMCGSYSTITFVKYVINYVCHENCV